MPFQGLPWTEFISCPVCCKVFNERQQRPISLGCGHTVCKSCLRSKLNDNRCPFDQTALPIDVDKLPANFALMHLVGAAIPEQEKEAVKTVSDNPKSYEQARQCIEDMAVHLKPLAENNSDDDSSTCSEPSPPRGTTDNNGSSNVSKCVLSRPMQRKLISLIHCQLLEEEGRSRAARIARSLGERIVSELLALHQYPHQLSANLWAAVRTRGCQFLGPAMQEEVLKLILLALEDGSFLSRKVLVLFVVQRLETRYPQASKTAIGHVVQLLYRASCFKVLKRDEESSLMQLKEEFRQYESLRREHDAQIIQIALEAGLRISPEQWSSLLYGDPIHKSHMQSIIDKHQSPQSFVQCVTELMSAVQRNGDNIGLQKLQPQLEFLSIIDPSPECAAPSWENLEAIMRSLNTVMTTFVEYLSNTEHRSRLDATPVQNTRYKTSMCRDYSARGICPRGNTCTFAHSQEELERYRSRSRRSGSRGAIAISERTASSLTLTECDQLRQVQFLSKIKGVATDNNGAVKALGKMLPGGEMADPKPVACSTSRDLCPIFNVMSLGQPHLPGVLHQKVPSGHCENVVNKEPDRTPFMVPPPQLITETRLTFSSPGIDGPDNPIIPTFGPQTCYHPNSPNIYPHSSHLPGTLTHGMPIRPPGMHFVMQPPFSPCSFMRPPNYQCEPPATSPGAQTISSLHPQASGDLSLGSMSSALQQPSDTTAIICNTGCVPCLQMPPERQMMMPCSIQGGDSLEDLTNRKQQIISDLQEEPVFKESGGSLVDSHKGFAGLKAVLSTNKQRHKAMPKSVSDMFVATRSTQSLDELLNEDVLQYNMKWSNGEDNLSEVTGSTTDSTEATLPGSLPDSNTTNSISFSMAATTTFGSQDTNGNSRLFTSVECGSGTTTDIIITTQTSSGADTEFCSFPNDDSDEMIIPFEHISVSKFGPISRMSKSKVYNSAPVQVTADSYKWMTPVLSVIPIDRPVATSMQMPTRFPRGGTEYLLTEPSVKPTPLEIPSIWQQTPQPSYHNIARMKAGAAEAVTNNERLAYELQAVELEIAMKTGKEPEPFTKMIQNAVMASDLVSKGMRYIPVMRQAYVPSHPM